MRLYRDLEAAFGPPDSPKLATGASQRSAISELTDLGYRGVFRLILFLNAKNRHTWTSSRRVELPPLCCACDGPAETFLGFYPKGLLRRLIDKRPLLSDVPHCRAHARSSEPALVVRAFDAHQPYASLVIFARGHEFLRATNELGATCGEPLPPWRTFPKSSPGSGWNQGTNELWLALAWRPFWNRLSREEREDYLLRWDAPHDWVEWLLSDRVPSELDRGDGRPR